MGGVSRHQSSGRDYEAKLFRIWIKGGHFAAWEEPDLFASELRAAFRSLR